jgi:hypothetical protein
MKTKANNVSLLPSVCGSTHAGHSYSRNISDLTNRVSPVLALLHQNSFAPNSLKNQMQNNHIINMHITEVLA